MKCEDYLNKWVKIKSVEYVDRMRHLIGNVYKCVNVYPGVQYPIEIQDVRGDWVFQTHEVELFESKVLDALYGG